jgi:hypothetical protein
VNDFATLPDDVIGRLAMMSMEEFSEKDVDVDGPMMETNANECKTTV